MENNKNKSKRYIGKLKNQNTKYGVMEKVLIDNVSNQNADGSPNNFYRGALIWVDAETGKSYQVKQLNLSTPKNGMDPRLTEKGFTCFITLDLEDDYQVTELA